MTSGEQACDLSRIDGILALMQTYCRFDDEDLEDEIWLRRRRRYIVALRAARRSQKGKKIVSLTLWRYGDPAHLAAAARGYVLREDRSETS